MKTRIPMKLLAALTALCLLLSFGVFYAMADEALDDLAVAQDEASAEEDALLAEFQALNTDVTRALNSGLAFDNNEFKILVLSDMDIGIGPYPAMLRAIDYMIEDTQPDLIVLNGDVTRKQSSVFGITGSGVSIAWICDMIPKSIPFTVTFGENDALLPVSKNRYLARYQRYSNFLGYDDVPPDAGVGNHNLFVYADAAGAAGKDIADVAFNLWMLDTNKDGLFRTQSAWYGAKEYDAIFLETDYIIPSMVFTHKSLLSTANVAGGAEMLYMMEEFGNVKGAVSSHARSISETTSGGTTFFGTPGMAFTGKGERATRGGTLFTVTLIPVSEPAAGEAPYDVSIVPTPKPIWPYFDDDTAEGIGPKHAFYKAGVNWFFGPPASFFGWMVGLFTNKYKVAYNITQFWGDIFNFML